MEKIKIIAIVFLMINFSCRTDNYQKTYYENGKLKLKIAVDKNEIPNGIFEEFYESGILKSRGAFIHGVKVDTIYNYNEEGILKAKGKLKEGLYPVDWWYYYDENGFLTSKVEYIVKGVESIKNQSIFYDKNGKVNRDLSSYFNLMIPDTLLVGKNLGKIRYISNYEKEKERYIYIVIENKYSDNKIVKDSFANDLDIIGFGIYAHKEGKLKVKGELIETIISEKKELSKLEIIEIKKFFSKEVVVKSKNL